MSTSKSDINDNNVPAITSKSNHSVLPIRGIDNISKVSCHIACAIQILCHAIPPIRRTFMKLRALEGNVHDYSYTKQNDCNSVLFDELLNFLGPMDTSKSNAVSSSSWDPQRLYRHLKVSSNLDFETVGDPSTALTSILRQIHDQLGLEWKQLLDQSIWEGQTQQLLVGRKPFGASSQDDENDHNCTKRYLQRIKTSKIKSMSCPLVLRLPPPSSSHLAAAGLENGVEKPLTIHELLCNVTRPQEVQGSQYPWDTLQPYTFKENFVDANEIDNISINADRKDNLDHSWVTHKFVRFHRIPRVWLLHVERPAPSKVVRDLCSIAKAKGNLFQQSTISSIEVTLELQSANFLRDTSMQTISTSTVTPDLFLLQGAILQVIELNEKDMDELTEDVEVHSVVLLHNRQQFQLETSEESRATSWVLIDDEDCYEIDEQRARKMLSGTVEVVSKGNTRFYTYYSSTLLVYSVPNTDSIEGWSDTIESIARTWMNHHQEKLLRPTADPAQLVGRRLKIKWSKGEFYKGIIAKYDPSTMKHQVVYDDGDVREYNLDKKTIEWIPDPEVVGNLDDRVVHEEMVIRVTKPIQPSVPYHVFALAFGIVLALHLPTTLLLLQYQDSYKHGVALEGTPQHATNRVLLEEFLQFVSFLVLDWSPWFASSLLSFFLAGLFLYMGFTKLSWHGNK